MGLFKKSEKDTRGEPLVPPPPGHEKEASDRNPLAPPSAQKLGHGMTRLPQGGNAEKTRKIDSTPARRSSQSGGPTPPGGLLPTPDWHEDYPGQNQAPGSGSAAESSGRAPSGSGGPRAPSADRGSHPLAGLQPPKASPRPSAARDAERHVSEEVAEATSLNSLLREAVERGASDLHLTRGVPPTIRLDGYLVPLDYKPMSKELCEKLVLSPLQTLQRAKFEEAWELDFSLDLPDAGRFRVNIHRQRGGVEAAYRVVNEVIMPLRRLGLPGVVEEIARKHSGLVLVTGPTGSGKSTTLAAIVDQINSERQCMVITVEDPIEYIHKNKRSIVKQREVWSDTRSFTNALRHVLRQDPDVIVIGEMRDLETISTALMAAETGHLVFATLHTPDATQTIDRMIDVFPPHQQEQARLQVANTLQSVIAQQLIPVPGNRGRVVAVEILIATIGVRKAIRSGKSEQLLTTMQTSWEKGMITMDKSLKMLYQQGLISFEDAISRCKYPDEFDNL